MLIQVNFKVNLTFSFVKYCVWLWFILLFCARSDYLNGAFEIMQSFIALLKKWKEVLNTLGTFLRMKGILNITKCTVKLG